jgi:DNA-binding NarL/FixJ family response regulator
VIFGLDIGLATGYSGITHLQPFIGRIRQMQMGESAATTVALGRFDDLLARGLRGVIEDDPSLELVADDVSPAELKPTLRARRPLVVILDTGSLSNQAEVRTLTASHPDTNFVLLAEQPSSIESSQLLSFGAAACLAKATQLRDVRNAIHLASRGLQLRPRDTYASPGSGLLTARELEVLARLQQRRSNAQIAAELHVSIETVRTHARHIYRKLGVGSRRELLAPVPPMN